MKHPVTEVEKIIKEGQVQMAYLRIKNFFKEELDFCVNIFCIVMRFYVTNFRGN